MISIKITRRETEVEADTWPTTRASAVQATPLATLPQRQYGSFANICSLGSRAKRSRDGQAVGNQQDHRQPQNSRQNYEDERGPSSACFSSNSGLCFCDDETIGRTGRSLLLLHCWACWVGYELVVLKTRSVCDGEQSVAIWVRRVRRARRASPKS